MQTALKIGDLVSLKNVKFNAYLGAEGILVDTSTVRAEPERFDDCLFQVHLQNQYSAARELQDELQSLGACDPTAQQQRVLKALERGKNNEIDLNESYMQQKMGAAVLFGDILQLKHVKSGKFITVSSSEVAEVERENLKVALIEDGSVLSWIQVMPRYKIDREGDVVSNMGEAYLRIAERRNEFLHCSERDLGQPHLPGTKELNCSLERSAWQLCRYQDAETRDGTHLQAGDIVVISDPESKAVLRVPQPHPVLFGDFDDNQSHTTLMGGDDEDGEALRVDTNTTVFEVQEGTNARTPDSNALWLIEKEDTTVGGIMNWRQEKFRFRHINIGRYLCVRETEEGELDFYTDDDRWNPQTLMSVHQLNAAENVVQNSAAIQLECDSIWLNRGEQHGKRFFGSGSIDRTGALSMLITRTDPQFRADVYVGMSSLEYLTGYGHHICDFDWDMAEEEFDFFSNVMVKLTHFTRAKQPEDVNGEAEAIDPELQRRIIVLRQGLLREQGIVDVVLDLLDALQECIGEGQGTISIARLGDEDGQDGGGHGTHGAGGTGHFRKADQVCDLCMRLLYYTTHGNPRNQMHVADRLTVLIAHVGQQAVAGRIVTEMLSTNMALQESKVGKREIDLFVGMIRESRMNSMYLNLLQAVCSCQGKGVDSNQCIVAAALLKDSSDIIIEVHDDYSNKTTVSWGGGDVYQPASKKHSVLGAELKRKGLPDLSLSWSSTSIDFSPLSLFGKLSVTLRELYQPLGGPAMGGLRDSLLGHGHVPTPSRRTSGRNMSAADQKRMVANYFVAELYLAAEMCLDRNYVAMLQLDSYFPYERLVTMLKVPDLSDNIRAAAIRLLTTLHVDRDPQNTCVTPRLTRTWSELSSEETLGFPSVPALRTAHFSLLQEEISVQIRKLRGEHWSEFTRRLMELLLKLIQFQFYTTVPQIKDISHPLVDALDRRHHELFKAESPRLERGLSAATRSRSVRTKNGPMSPGNRSNSMEKYRVTNSALDKSLSAARSAAADDDKSNRTPFGDDGSLEAKEQDTQSERSGDDIDGIEQGAGLSGISGLSALFLAGENKDKENSWQSDTFKFLESIRAMSVVLTLVFVAIAVSAAQMITDSSAFGYTLFEYIVAAMFTSELLLRMYCYAYLQGELWSFFQNVFYVIDIVVVALDLLLIFSGNLLGDVGGFTKSLRAIRLVRLVRVLRAARLVKKIAAELTGKPTAPWIPPERYIKTPEHELKTMVEMVHVLQHVTRLIHDRYLSLLLHAFYDWYSNKSERHPVGVFEDVIAQGADLSLDATGCMDLVFLDLTMYDHPSLVQGVLSVLMTHHSTRRMLLDSASGVQLLTTVKRERQFNDIREKLQRLEQLAETHELWGELQSNEDNKQNDQIHSILHELLDHVRLRCTVLKLEGAYEPDPEVQNLLRNLGLFDIAMKVLELGSGIEDEEAEEPYNENTRAIICECNELLRWFVVANPENQMLAFAQLNEFVSTIDEGFNTSVVVRATFEQNEGLMKQIPRSMISAVCDKIVENGHLPHYLDLFLSITNDGEKNVLANQYEIIKQMTDVARIDTVLQLPRGPGDENYEHRKELMIGLDQDELDIEDLPPELAYHIKLLMLFAGCTVGRVNITTVEAKLQSLYDAPDVLAAILDPDSHITLKVALAHFLFHAFVEVEMMVPGLDREPLMWQYFDSVIEVIEQAKDELILLEKTSWENEMISRNRLNYAMIAINNVQGFFMRYYDAANFEEVRASFRRREGLGVLGEESKADEISDTQSGFGDEDDDAMRLPVNPDTVVRRLFEAIKSVYDLQSPYLQPDHVQSAFEAIEALLERGGGVIAAELPAKLTRQASTGSFEVIESVEHPMKALDNTQESAAFASFVEQLQESDDLQERIEADRADIISVIENLPRRSEGTNSDVEVRYEPLIRKLVKHIRDRLVMTNGKKSLDPACTETSIWIIQLFRKMIERLWGMTIDERDDDGGEEEDEMAAPVQHLLNECGATTLCLDLVAVGIDSDLILECVRLCVALLFKEGGNTEVQQTMFDHLASHNSEMFFREVREALQKLVSWHKWNGIVVLDEDDEPDPPDMIILIRMLQLMCEGHFGANQDIMREQPHNSTSINLLDDFVQYLGTLSKMQCRTSTNAAQAVADVVLEVIQGPCEGNQEHFSLNTELIETLNRMMRADESRKGLDLDEEEERELKKTGMDIFQGLLEGQGPGSPVYERVLSVIHLDVLKMICLGNEDEDEEEMTDLQTEALVLIQMLFDYKPSLREEIQLPDWINRVMGKDVASVEVVWRGSLQRRFFLVPEICADLSEASKDKVVEEVDRSNQENKLQDFLRRAHDLYREILHQQVLKEKKLAKVFSRSNQEFATWVSFFLACLINGLLVAFYAESDDGRTVELPPEVRPLVQALNVFQIGFAVFTMILFFVVRVPVRYASILASGKGKYHSMLLTATDHMTLYYFFYVVVAVFGVTTSHVFLTFLLLDIIVKNSTTRDVLYAVMYPFRQLAMTLVLGLFVIYIFAMFTFFNFRDDFDPVWGGADDCRTLWDCLKVSVNYGLRLSGGTGDIMTHTLGRRLPLDLMYFLIVLIVLLNIIFGIIIDTFGELRNQKEERMRDTTQRCFICGIDKHVFDQHAEGHNGFREHIKHDHYMWNYLNFIFFVWEQDKDDDDGMEQYVRRCIDAMDLSWFPMERAICLDDGEDGEEDSWHKRLEEHTSTLMHHHNHHENFRTEMAASMDKIVKRVEATAEKLQRIEQRLNQTMPPGHVSGPLPPINGAVARTSSGSGSGNHTPDDQGFFSVRVIVVDAMGVSPAVAHGASEPFVICRILVGPDQRVAGQTTPTLVQDGVANFAGVADHAITVADRVSMRDGTRVEMQLIVLDRRNSPAGVVGTVTASISQLAAMAGVRNSLELESPENTNRQTPNAKITFTTVLESR